MANCLHRQLAELEQLTAKAAGSLSTGKPAGPPADHPAGQQAAEQTRLPAGERPSSPKARTSQVAAPSPPAAVAYQVELSPKAKKLWRAAKLKAAIGKPIETVRTYYEEVRPSRASFSEPQATGVAKQQLQHVRSSGSLCAVLGPPQVQLQHPGAVQASPPGPVQCALGRQRSVPHLQAALIPDTVGGPTPAISGSPLMYRVGLGAAEPAGSRRRSLSPVCSPRVPQQFGLRPTLSATPPAPAAAAQRADLRARSVGSVTASPLVPQAAPNLQAQAPGLGACRRAASPPRARVPTAPTWRPPQSARPRLGCSEPFLRAPPPLRWPLPPQAAALEAPAQRRAISPPAFRQCQAGLSLPTALLPNALRI